MFATGSASGSAADGNHIRVTAVPLDHSAAVDSISPRDIYGCLCVAITDFQPVAVKSPWASDDVVDTRLFDMNGRQVNRRTAAPGVYILRTTDKHGHTQSVKVLKH